MIEMSIKNIPGSQNHLIYGVDDNPSMGKKVLFGLQHIFAAFSGIVVVPLVISGTLSIGQLVAFNMLAGQISSPIIRLSQIWQDFQQVGISVKRLGDGLNFPAENSARCLVMNFIQLTLLSAIQ